MEAPFWLDEPTILFKRNEISQLWPSVDMTSNEKLNAVTRTVILLTVTGYLFKMSSKIILTGIITLGIVLVMYYIKKDKSKKKEGFTDPRLYNIMKDNYTLPAKNNPAMNVLLTERKDNPNRKAAAPAYNKEIETKMNNETQKFVVSKFDDTTDIDDRLFKDLGDSFNFDQSMRTWYATANTQIPNAQKAFAEWCYGDMISCKEGNEFACTRSAPPRWTHN
tara:strand:- start:92 stop:754 length:663 start_codon:yes stop_codon:yes gene_type:complete